MGVNVIQKYASFTTTTNPACNLDSTVRTDSSDNFVDGDITPKSNETGTEAYRNFIKIKGSPKLLGITGSFSNAAAVTKLKVWFWIPNRETINNNDILSGYAKSTVEYTLTQGSANAIQIDSVPSKWVYVECTSNPSAGTADIYIEEYPQDANLF